MKKELFIEEKEPYEDFLNYKYPKINYVKSNLMISVTNTITKIIKDTYCCKLDSIQDFKDNKEELISKKHVNNFFNIYQEIYFPVIFNFLQNVKVQTIENISDFEKKINVFDFYSDSDLSLNVYLEGNKNISGQLLLMEWSKEDFNKVKTLDEISIIFFSIYQNNYKDTNEVLKFIIKDDDRRRKIKSKTVITPQYDLVGV